MSKVKPTTKEQLVYFLHNHISLGTYDKKFIENLLLRYIATLNPVTSNQSKLLDKVTLRYERQLRKENIVASDMIELDWGIPPIPSSPKFTDAHISLNGEHVEVRCPFKSEFIKCFKELPSAKWNKDTKTWYVNANEQSIKKITELVNQYYETVNYCPEIKAILNTVEVFKDMRYWNPTLVKSNGLFFIVAVNETLNEAIKDIPLNDSLSTLAKLVHYGVTISRSVLNDIPSNISDADLLLALEKDVTLEHDIEGVASKLKLIGVDYVLIREWNAIAKNIGSKLKERLIIDGIDVDILDRTAKPSLAKIRKSTLPVLITGFSFSTPLSTLFAKVIGLTNSQPIEIK